MQTTKPSRSTFSVPMNLVAPSFRLLLRALTLVGGPIRLLNGYVLLDLTLYPLTTPHVTLYP